MPFVSIRLVKEVIASDPAGKKAEVAAAVSTALAKVMNLPESDVWIVFEEVEAKDWYLGKSSVKQLRFDKS